MVTAQYRLLTEGLGVNHLRLVIGTSMGGMHAWLWGEMYPTFMDALMPLASLPGQISGRNRMWRRIADRRDPERPRVEGRELHDAAGGPGHGGGRAGSGQQQPAAAAAGVAHAGGGRHVRSTTTSGNYVKDADADDVLYALQASWDYDPAPALETIVAPLYAVNSADDLVNPPELGILEREIARVPRGKAAVIP